MQSGGRLPPLRERSKSLAANRGVNHEIPQHVAEAIRDFLDGAGIAQSASKRQGLNVGTVASAEKIST